MGEKESNSMAGWEIAFSPTLNSLELFSKENGRWIPLRATDKAIIELGDLLSSAETALSRLREARHIFLAELIECQRLLLEIVSNGGMDLVAKDGLIAKSEQIYGWFSSTHVKVRNLEKKLNEIKIHINERNDNEQG
ncbi:MAG: hypothetical protein UT24_C0027G0005 [Candidatus Woesebacteria bacterium GW2011_GWB1_39_12]|uniref:Uncharacterized protein n=1 Tax=Candidatus Woesebacteria bacterium GW2011_GWB1_39_12 TaxID=1618574 RepID=A0A0G0M4R2_9BACT|nr:MAG: hypothetical protein UT24_C0027G0005 [Candidatus Woesebacteria bacterium GW2011_GWB1_39_12]